MNTSHDENDANPMGMRLEFTMLLAGWLFGLAGILRYLGLL